MTAAARLMSILRAAPASLNGWPTRRLSGPLASGWRVYLVRTVTGELGPAIDPVAGSWAVELNGTDGGQVTLRKADLRRLERKWFAPWWAGVLFTYTHEGVERPITGGPVTGWPSETREELVLDWAGPRRIFERRYLEGTVDVKLTGMSLGGIAWALVEAGMAKPGGALPIVRGTPAEAGDHQRTFEWWNVANNAVDKRLEELSNVIDGPDVMLRPRWATEARTRVVWALVTGTSVNPTIAQDWLPDWDTTAARSGVEAIGIKSSADHLAGRVWATGAGEGAGTVVRSATDLTFVAEGGPLLEAVVSDSDQAKADVIADLARSELAAREDMLAQVSIGVRANDPKAPLGSWHVGDKAAVTLGDEWETIPAGTHALRIIRASGDLTHKVALEFQEDSY